MSAHDTTKDPTERMEILTLGLDLDESQARISRAAIVHSVTKITEPGGSASVPDLLDTRVLVVGGGSLAGNTDPRLVGRVTESKVDLLVGAQILELLRVVVGQEEEIGTCALCYCHRSSDGL